MISSIKKIVFKNFPPLLKEINDPPQSLYVKGVLPDPNKYTYLAVVGSRNCSSYGQEACRHLIHSLQNLPVVIVSGLALGIDSIAHRSALESNLKTVAIPGSGLDNEVLYPRSHFNLASNILKTGGALLSELPPSTKAAPWTFPRRNRIMAGLSQAVLIIEAREKSGTLITARLAMEYNRDVLAVPGSIFNQNSTGPLSLIKDGATPIANTSDLKEALGFNREEIVKETLNIDTLSPVEKDIYLLLQIENKPKTDLFIHLKHSSSDINTALSMLELKGLIVNTGGEIRLIE
ncbi:MAG: DNA-processing protein DprA [Candidatus Paceibacterota bacterium]